MTISRRFRYFRPTQPLILSLVASTLLLISGFPTCAGTPAENCSASKMKSAANKAKQGLACHAKAAKKGQAVDADCLAKASAKLQSGFGKAEAKGGCPSLGNSGSVGATLDTMISDIASMLSHNSDEASRKCSASKRKAAGKKAAGLLKCYAKATKKGEALDPDCVTKIETKAAKAFEKAELKGGCAVGGNIGDVCTIVDNTVDEVIGSLVAECGNDTTEIGEECDGSDDAACPGTCVSSCRCAGDCGNGTIDGEEECDDGGNTSGDGCRDDCVLEDESALCEGVPSTAGTSLALELVGNFSSPVHVTAPRLDPSRLFVVEQPGVIRIVKNGTLLPTAFLDIQSIVHHNFESGLLSLAFHPDYETNGRFFVNYTREPDNTTVISRFEVSANPDVANAASEQVLMTITQTFLNHNGGQIAFGSDGHLYIGMGDGGSGGDPNEAGQDDNTLLGKLLRVDVDVDTVPFHAVPADNPNSGAGLPLGLIWAKGLRNPWRFSFDRLNGDLFIGDVGQNTIEEVNYTPGTSTGGENYGWDDMEGTACHEPTTGCLTAGRQLPIVEYLQVGNGCSVTGGHIYRGCALPDIDGTYFYADYCTGFVRTFEVLAGAAVNEQDFTASVGTSGNISSFGEDARGEIYIANLGGEVYKIVAGP